MGEKSENPRRRSVGNSLFTGSRGKDGKGFLDAAREEARAVYWSESYEKRVRRARFRIDKLLRFQLEAELTLDLNDCFNAWYSCYALGKEGELAESVLEDFYQGGKVADLLGKLKAFVGEIDPEEEAEDVRIEAYHNHVFFLKHNYEKLLRHYQEESGTPPDELPPRNKDTVLWFVKNECGNIAVLKDLPAAREHAVRILEKYHLPEDGESRAYRRMKISEEDLKAIRFVLQTVDILDAEVRKDAANQELLVKTQAFAEKTEARKKKIEESKEVLRVITEVMTPEWFTAWDPRVEGNAICEMDTAGLKEFYLQQLEKIPF